MARRAKEPPSGRPTRSRERFKRRLAVCGGRTTEPEYFELVRDELGLSRTLSINKAKAGLDPLSLVRQAVKLAKAEKTAAKADGRDGYASIWAITDCDDFKCLGKAQQEAKGSGVDLIVSNPCFEAWLIDHVQVCPDSCASTADCQKFARQKGVVSATSHDRKSADRAKAVETGLVSGRMEQAVENAAKHNTPAKRAVRELNPDRIPNYAVWTDMESVMQTLLTDSRQNR